MISKKGGKVVFNFKIKKLITILTVLCMLVSVPLQTFAAEKPTSVLDLDSSVNVIIGDVLLPSFDTAAIYRSIAFAERNGNDSNVYYMSFSGSPKDGIYNLTQKFALDQSPNGNRIATIDIDGNISGVGNDIFNGIRYQMDTGTKVITAYEDIPNVNDPQEDNTNIAVRPGYEGMVEVNGNVITVPQGYIDEDFIRSAIQSTDGTKQTYSVVGNKLTVTAQNGSDHLDYDIEENNFGAGGGSKLPAVASSQSNYNPATQTWTIPTGEKTSSMLTLNEGWEYSGFFGLSADAFSGVGRVVTFTYSKLSTSVFESIVRAVYRENNKYDYDYITVKRGLLNDLNVDLTSGDGIVTLAPQPSSVTGVTYYTYGPAAAAIPAYEAPISGINGAEVYSADLVIKGTNGKEMFVQVYQVEDGKIVGFGQNSATPKTSSPMNQLNVVLKAGDGIVTLEPIAVVTGVTYYTYGKVEATAPTFEALISSVPEAIYYNAEVNIIGKNGEEMFVQVYQVDAEDKIIGYGEAKTTPKAPTLAELNVVLTSGNNTVTLAPITVTGATYYTYGPTSVAPSTYGYGTLIGSVPGAAYYNISVTIPGTNGTPMYVQVYQVDAEDKVIGFGEASTTPAIPLNSLTVELTPGNNTVTLATQPSTVTGATYYTYGSTSVAPSTYGYGTLIGSVPGAAYYNANVTIPGTNGTPMYVQVYQVDAEDKVIGFGEASTTPAIPLNSLTVELTPGNGTVTLAPITVTGATYYTYGLTSVASSTYGYGTLISSVPGAAYYNANVTIPGTNSITMFVQVYQVDAENKVIGFGEASTMPTAPGATQPGVLVGIVITGLEDLLGGADDNGKGILTYTKDAATDTVYDALKYKVMSSAEANALEMNGVAGSEWKTLDASRATLVLGSNAADVNGKVLVIAGLDGDSKIQAILKYDIGENTIKDCPDTLTEFNGVLLDMPADASDPGNVVHNNGRGLLNYTTTVSAASYEFRYIVVDSATVAVDVYSKGDSAASGWTALTKVGSSNDAIVNLGANAAEAKTKKLLIAEVETASNAIRAITSINIDWIVDADEEIALEFAYTLSDMSSDSNGKGILVFTTTTTEKFHYLVVNNALAVAAITDETSADVSGTNWELLDDTTTTGTAEVVLGNNAGDANGKILVIAEVGANDKVIAIKAIVIRGIVDDE